MKYINVLQYATCQEVKLKWNLWHPITWLYVVFAFTLSMIGHAITVVSTYKYEILKDVTCTIDHTNTKFKRNPLFKKEEVMKILDLSLTYHWYNEIASGRKKEEYRQLNGYYYKRLTTQGVLDLFDGKFKHYDAVCFHRGQGSRTTMLVECKGIRIGYGKEEWGAPKKKVFIITLGNILEKSDNGQIIK